MAVSLVPPGGDDWTEEELDIAKEAVQKHRDTKLSWRYKRWPWGERVQLESIIPGHYVLSMYGPRGGYLGGTSLDKDGLKCLTTALVEHLESLDEIIGGVVWAS